MDDGPPVAVLLEPDDAHAGLAACGRLLERLDAGPDALDDHEPADDDYLSALATFGGAHYGRWTQPALPSPDLEWIGRALGTVVDLPAGPALILGAATAGEALQIDDREIVVLDGSVPLLAFASGLAERDQWLPVQATPRRYRLQRITLPDDARARLRRVAFVAADAREPPLVPGTFAVVVALNLFDSITHPHELLLRAGALLAPGGVMLLSAPYNWNDDVTAPERRLDAGLSPREDHAAAMEARIEALLPALSIVWRERDLPWLLRIHDRLTCEFRLHAMLLRRDRP